MQNHGDLHNTDSDGNIILNNKKAENKFSHIFRLGLLRNNIRTNLHA